MTRKMVPFETLDAAVETLQRVESERDELSEECHGFEERVRTLTQERDAWRERYNGSEARVKELGRAEAQRDEAVALLRRARDVLNRAADEYWEWVSDREEAKALRAEIDALLVVERGKQSKDAAESG